jgi:predicted permease
MRSGLSRDQARRAALLRFGSVEAIREEYRDRGGVPLLRHTAFALRDARRALLRTPRFNLLVVFVLAVGVGANAAVFGLVDGLLFRAPEHVRAPERLVTVSDVRNYVHYRELAERATHLDVAAYVRRPVVLGVGEDAFQLDAECVTSTYFTVLGPSVTGPGFLPLRAEPPGGAPSVVLADSIWSTRLGRDPSVLGRSIPIAGVPHTVLAIAPPGFRGLGIVAVDAWILLAAEPAACHPNGRNALHSPSGSWLTVIGRLHDGVPLEQAEAETQRLDIGAADLPPNSKSARALEPVHETRRSSVARDSRIALWLAAAAVIMLLVACVNAAGLLGGRAVERRREIGVRLQLGASRTQVFTQLLAENLGLVLACGVVALLVAAWMTSLFHAFFPISASGAFLDRRSIGLLAGVALVAAVLSAIVPAAQTARGDLPDLWRSGHPVGQARSRLRHPLLIVQVTFAMVLVTGAGLFVRSLHNLKADVGYDLERVIVASIDLERAGIRRHLEKLAVFDAVLQRLEQVPGVAAVGLSTSPPLGSGQSYVVLPRPPGAMPTSLPRTVNDVSPGYFEA